MISQLIGCQSNDYHDIMISQLIRWLLWHHDLFECQGTFSMYLKMIEIGQACIYVCTVSHSNSKTGQTDLHSVSCLHFKFWESTCLTLTGRLTKKNKKNTRAYTYAPLQKERWPNGSSTQSGLLPANVSTQTGALPQPRELAWNWELWGVPLYLQEAFEDPTLQRAPPFLTGTFNWHH